MDLKMQPDIESLEQSAEQLEALVKSHDVRLKNKPIGQVNKIGELAVHTRALAEYLNEFEKARIKTRSIIQETSQNLDTAKTVQAKKKALRRSIAELALIGKELRLLKAPTAYTDSVIHAPQADFIDRTVSNMKRIGQTLARKDPDEPAQLTKQLFDDSLSFSKTQTKLWARYRRVNKFI